MDQVSRPFSAASRRVDCDPDVHGILTPKLIWRVSCKTAERDDLTPMHSTRPVIDNLILDISMSGELLDTSASVPHENPTLSFHVSSIPHGIRIRGPSSF
jgi:hypothetical protein